jgi:hypothetical protein
VRGVRAHTDLTEGGGVAVAWIKVVDDKSADEQLADVYARMLDPAYRRVDNTILRPRGHSTWPPGPRALSARWHTRSPQRSVLV